MRDVIERARGQIEEIFQICDKMKKNLSCLAIYDLNNEVPTTPCLNNEELDCRKLYHRCNDVADFLLNNNLSHTQNLKRLLEAISSKREVCEKDVDDILFEFDKLNRALDKLEFASQQSNDRVEPIVKKTLPPKIFISHSSKDLEYITYLVELLEDIGLNEKQLFCSSFTEYGIPLDQDIYEHLKAEFEQYKLNVFFVLSKNYYESPACLNEMGAAWILQSTYSTFLLPEFEFTDIKGAINPNRISIKLDSSDVKSRLNEMKDKIVKLFDLPEISQTKWERYRDNFISKIDTYKNK